MEENTNNRIRTVYKTCLVQRFNQKGLRFVKVAHVHAANGLAIQKQTGGLIPLRHILEYQIRLLNLRPSLIHHHPAKPIN